MFDEAVSATLLRFIALSIAVGVAWFPGASGDFVWIDHVEIEQGGYRVRNTSDLVAVWTHSLDQYLERDQGELSATGGYLRPVYAISLTLDWFLWKADPFLFHIENIVWHLMVSFGLYLLGGFVLRDHEDGEQIAFWSALLFSLHPFGVHSVTWISGRKDLLCAAFSVFSLLAFAVTAGFNLQNRFTSIQANQFYSGKTIRRLCVVSAGCFVLAVLSKELAFVVPVVAAIWFWFETGNRDRAKQCLGGLSCVALLWIVCLVVLIYRFAVLGGAGLDANDPSDTLLGSIGTSARRWWWYLARALFPISPTIVDRWPITREVSGADLAAMFGLAAVVIGGVFGLVRRPRFVFFALWYAVWMLPASGLIPLRHVYAERYLYPATWGLLVLVVAAVYWVTEDAWDKLRHPLMVIIAAGMLAGTIYESRYWRSDEILFSHAVDQDPQYVEGRIALARLALDDGDNEQAISQSNLAIKAAGNPDDASYWSPFVAHTNLGLALYKERKFAAAARSFDEARRARPDNARSYYHLGLNAAGWGKLAEADEYYQLALERNPNDNLTRGNLGYVKLMLGQVDQSIEMLAPLVAEQPGDRTNRINLGSAMLIAGDFGNAEKQFEAVLRAPGQDPVSLAKLAWAKWELGKSTEAMVHIMAAAEQDPDHPTVRQVAQMIIRAKQPK